MEKKIWDEFLVAFKWISILLSSSKSFENIRMPGTWMALSALVFWLSGIRSTLLIVKQLDVHCEKPKLRTAILLLWLLPFNTDSAEKPADAFCKFTDTREHSQAYVYGFIWASVPKLDLF